MSVEADKETRKMRILGHTALHSTMSGISITKQLRIMGYSGEWVDNKVKKENPGMSVKLLISVQAFGFHLGLNTECILTRFETRQSLQLYF
jgi:hypothetical protein